MHRRITFALAVLAVGALVAADRLPRASAAEPEVAGNWLLTTSPRAGIEQAYAIIKVELKDGKPQASVLHSPLKGLKLSVSKFAVSGTTITFDSSIGWAFEGSLDRGGKVAVGSFGSDQLPNRAKLTRTDKTELTADEAIAKTDVPAPAAQAQKLNAAPLPLRNQAMREKDAQKRGELMAKATAAQKEADEKVPGLLREVLSDHKDTLFALDAALELVRRGAKSKLTADEAGQLLALIEQRTAGYGPRYAQLQTIAAVEAVVAQKALAGTAEGAAERLSKAAGASAEFRGRALTARKAALEALGRGDDAKAVAGEIAKLEVQIDTEYLAKVPPFKPTAFAGRKDKSANRVAVLELFTGAQCPPCVAADVAFDALLKSHKATDLVLLQYHMHIPGPDPLTNPATVARWDYYQKEFPDDMRGTPSTLFNGKPLAGGGGGMANAESKYKQYADIIAPLLEETTAVKVAGKVTRTGDKLDIAVEVTGAEGEDTRLRLLVVEENIKYVGGNKLRFHHQVVRATAGGADGVAVKDKAFAHTATVDLGTVRKDLTTYLDEFARMRPFPNPARPLDLKGLRVVALVQNDKTKEILQAAQIDVQGAEGSR
ncbi:hypothetical protein GobsT_34910 [Gemmata obscuriglobus]|uniref:Thioredoxin domain-containing protein n=1 Tax=Gemmata obscuriglobus TaxID=114 RepID=A0A2Z3GY77_9BACT|nr:hypothetical protein [Gemmata obscuriglobus]AWM38378.1 hypothetical protein C1280_16190 [Gemmata obscuriglobus]QEG28705.1 hypothetical protein GobsT_34910 [Gemmata obscuriglobus]VTS06973.1 hypothetical conserved protein : Uncharacterized protein OS=Singulisphaera acidiphila (strain ATCC BAA-1392 / DSM 18658 / VKM B-2454 / MOB10) GN=Sinac_3186 PE=4 SV=1 [Gemmata obscuriglobus UQM 2246]